MAFLDPAFLLLGLLAGPIILLYMLRLRRREVVVSSTLLWQKLLRDRQANAPWQRLRRNLLLLLQLLILGMLALALARPFMPIPSIVSGSVVIVLDASASMQATDVRPNRFEVAKAEVRRMINDLSGSSQMTIIEAGHSPRALANATSDKRLLRQALNASRPTMGETDWVAAIALASGAAQGFRDARIVIVSDGGLSGEPGPLAAETLFVPIGESGENLAIAALATRDAEGVSQLFANVRNEGVEERTALFSLLLDDVLFDSRRISVPSGGSATLTWELPEGATVIQGKLSNHEGDQLALDDVAWTVHAGGTSNRLLLVTDGNVFLEQAFSVLPGVEAFKVGRDVAIGAQDGESFDIYVFDGVGLPDPAPTGDLLIVNPLQDRGSDGYYGDLLEVGGVFSDTVAVRLADTPLLQFVDWRNVHVNRAKRVAAPWARTLVAAEGGALFLAGENSGRRIAVITFDLHESDLPLQIAFPVLMANISEWLNPGRVVSAGSGLAPGSPVTISPGVGANRVNVVKPDGTAWSDSADSGEVVFSETEQLGVYEIRVTDRDGERSAGHFAVNLFSATEASIAPVSNLPVGQGALESASERNIARRELWPWLVGLAFAVLVVEWWVHHRGLQLPGFDLR